MKKQQIQQQEQLSAYDKKVIYDMFYMSIEWLEKYIEIAYKNDFPDWENRKQIRDNINIKRTDIYSNPEKAKGAFATQMFLFGTSLEDTPLFREDLKKEFCQWISATKIDSSNCPDELKHLLYGFNEVMDGNTEKVRKDMENRKREIEIDSPKYLEQMNKLFGNIQIPMDNEKETSKNLGGKTHLDMRVGNKFGGGSAEQGERTFQQIAGEVSASHGSDFHFYSQKGQQQQQQWTNFEIIQDVKVNPQNWRFDEVITEYDDRGGALRKVIALIHNSAEIGFDGAVLGNNQPVYLAQRFNQNEIAEINQALNISQTPNYDNWTREQFIAEINRLKAENEQLKNNQTLTSSERQERIQRNSQKLEQLSSLIDSSPVNSNSLPSSLVIGGVVLGTIGLVSFLAIRKVAKVKK
jgi:hypothetical protein